MRHFLSLLVLIFGLPLAACAQQVPRLIAPPDTTVQIEPVRSILVVNVIDTVSVRPYNPPEIYAKWWQEIMQCTGLHINKKHRESVRWMYVRADGFVINGIPIVYDGYSFVRDNQLMVVFFGVTNEKLVKHEMIHFLMYHNALKAGHPDNLFVKCKVDSKSIGTVK
jgi:hypothetical protein